MRRLTATATIAAMTIVASIAAEFAPHWVDAPMRAGFIPARLSGVGTDYAAVPLWLTPLSSTLVHAGLLHLVSNLLILVFTGLQCERALGRRGVFILYLLGAYAAALAQWVPDPMSVTPMVGASGAASALFGAYSLLYGRSRAGRIGPLPARWVTALWLGAAWVGINLLAGYALQLEGIAIAAAAHIGGFAAGLLLAVPLLRWRRSSRQS
ncbi:rhomboid family intramembrane serine protease [Sphingomonas psychrotolerans]|uniref:Rhomboid family intramembrane serine protease n=1 Tax=Sphingomonas psychrotolerans TaxID=1327635 RepID=A0ABU3N2R0_9SPHN|nr:rhomboid family intramembrane serine protease [Sphingomonas psychrotolerans]MDT8758057.1 rhomboid family intramembrane serine protease [Sphingomonas psychrotolerans]